MSFRLHFWSVGLGIASLLAATPAAYGQALRIDGAATGTVAAAPDYAAEVIGDPWDFDSRADYDYTYSLGEDTPEDAGNEFTSWQPYPTVANGVFTGVMRERRPALQMLFGGIPGAMNSLQRTGIHYPIETSRYTWLSFRVRRSWVAGHTEAMKVLWEAGRRGPGTPAGVFIMLARGYDNDMGRWVNQTPIGAQGAADEWQVYRIRLTDAAQFAGNRFGGTPWQGQMMGLSLSPVDGPIGSTVQMDWVRLTAPRTVQLSWTGLGGNVIIRATNGSQQLQVYPEDLLPHTDDSNPRATTGAFPDNSSLVWDYGHLTPGTWTLTATGAGATRTATLTVQDVPHFSVLNPDAAGGQDLATSVIGDPWDLANPEDVFRYSTPANGLYDIKNAAFTPTGLTGTAYHSGRYGTIHSDSQVRFFDDDQTSRFSLTPDQARRFHRLTFTLEYNIPLPSPLTFDPLAPQPFLTDHANGRPGVGGMARILWRTAADRGGAFSQTCGLPVQGGGPMTVTMDLAQYTSSNDCLDEGLQSLPGGQAWGALTSNLTNFRIDINEGQLDVPFKLSNVRLAADDEPDDSGTFVVQWAARAAPYTGMPTTPTGSVALYLDNDRNPDNGRTLITNGLNASVGAYVWDLARMPGGVPPGTYWIYVEMSRPSGYTYGKYSTGPLQVTRTYDAPLTLSQWQQLYGITNMSADQDRDGVSNQEEFERGTSPFVSNRWELAEGATGFFNERVALANPEGRSAIARVTVLFGQMPQLGESTPPAPVVQDIPLAAYGRHTVNINALPNATYNGQGRAVSVIVEALRGAVVTERTMSWGDSAWGGHTGKAVTSPRTTWFLAEGAASSFFSTFILLTSTGEAPPTITLDYLVEGGPVVTETHTFPSSPARLTIWTNQIPALNGKAFSTRISSTQPITVERAMYFNRGGRSFEGGHASAGVPDAATNWFVAEGATGPNFDTYLLLANPGTSSTTATVRYLTPEGPYTATYVLPASSRRTLFVDAELSAVSGRDAVNTQIDVSAEVTATSPIVVERAMYWFGTSNNWTDAHNSAGLTSTSTLWGLAEGENGGALGYQTFVLLANPSANTASVRLRLLREGGQASVLSAPINVAAGSRFTCYAGQPGPCQDVFAQLQSGERFGVLIESTNGVPIVVERAMYWNGGGEFFGAGTNESATPLR